MSQWTEMGGILGYVAAALATAYGIYHRQIAQRHLEKKDHLDAHHLRQVEAFHEMSKLKDGYKSWAEDLEDRFASLKNEVDEMRKTQGENMTKIINLEADKNACMEKVAYVSGQATQLMGLLTEFHKEKFSPGS